jgi:hypothetical protein
MKSFTSRQFRSMYANLPEDVKVRSEPAYQLFRRNPTHPGLHFKKVDDRNEIYSARVVLGYRAMTSCCTDVTCLGRTLARLRSVCRASSWFAQP